MINTPPRDLVAMNIDAIVAEYFPVHLPPVLIGEDEFRAALVRAAEQAAPVGELAKMEARKDAAYLERNQVVAALARCYPSGTKRTSIEGWSDDWHGCVYIDLPSGQASWHYHDSHAYLFADLPPYMGTWDGHSTEEKYKRLAALPSAAGG